MKFLFAAILGLCVTASSTFAAGFSKFNKVAVKVDVVPVQLNAVSIAYPVAQSYPVALPTYAEPIRYHAPVCAPVTTTYSAPVAYQAPVAIKTSFVAGVPVVKSHFAVSGFKSAVVINRGFRNAVVVRRGLFGNRVVVNRGFGNRVVVRRGLFGNRVIVNRGFGNRVVVRRGLFGNRVVVNRGFGNAVIVNRGLFSGVFGNTAVVVR